MSQRLLPAYPLFTKDPYFSVWSTHDTLNGGDTSFWNGNTRPTYGTVFCDGKKYCFLGKVKGYEPLTQSAVAVTAFSTDYTFTCPQFTLSLRFISPLPPDNYEVLSCPVCYLEYKIIPKTALRSVKIALALHEKHCYHTLAGEVIGSTFQFDKYELAFFGLSRQFPMSHTGDSMAADWGYTYLAAQKAMFLGQSGFDGFLSSGELSYSLDRSETKYIVGLDEYTDVTSPVSGKFLVAFDDICSIYYFGEFVRGYYFRDGKTIFDAVADAFDSFGAVTAAADEFDRRLAADAGAIGQDYLLITRAAVRQTMAAHKLVQTVSGELLFLSKECHSNGCIATVDITYPSMPMFLLYNPDLIAGMLRPIFTFARMPVWQFDFAPHDAGTFPYCLGQTYGMRGVGGDCWWLANSIRRERGNGEIVSHPLFYTYPASADIYREERQMPLEECGNMLIVSALLLLSKSDKTIVTSNLDLLEKWCNYLINAGIVPANQLCTDDFDGHIDKNVNLSIKAITGIKAFALICNALGEPQRGKTADETAHRYAKELTDKFKTRKCLPLSFDGENGSYSLKYNLAIDKVFNFGLFEPAFFEREFDYYLSRLTDFGVPLDHRSDITKSDWELFVCALTDDERKCDPIYARIAYYLKNSPSRVPFSDLYHCDDGEKREFQNRPVQGGVFMPLLKRRQLEQRREGK